MQYINEEALNGLQSPKISIVLINNYSLDSKLYTDTIWSYGRIIRTLIFFILNMTRLYNGIQPKNTPAQSLSN